MPPKQQSKADLAKKQKIIEDKTFGLKNKNKSKNVQKYVQILKQSVQPKPDPSKTAAKYVYIFYRRTIEDWDQETLEKVVESKKNEYQQNKPTDIICKYFLEAVEKKQYDWFWVCPNGSKNCHYGHVLPPGYVLKSQMKALLEEESEKIPIKEEIENQRVKLTTSTPMTPELFMQWKKKKIAERDAGLLQKCGRELFLSDSSLFVDDAEADEKYHKEEEPAVAEKKANENSNGDGPSNSATAGGDAEVTNVDDDDELDIDELNELEASLSNVAIQEPGTHA
ncbi:zinc finger CCCH domain-containing protein 11-like [Pyrus ussuriensis x Pyrus communis]|uniref:Zinc finger CCCH domain-containing protein 11-like n=1 Tax=Pyrus ussuriensis x Pyrus communis TaxID=2448454 RepID=A0A5N5FMA7_9ROSA|nr:zinc finger CCCH domain-containing protein 11-like [Pyrus ussuriensis x Pyrus communis]